MSILTAKQITARLNALDCLADQVGETVEQVEALINGRSAGVRAAFETYGGKLDDLRDQVAAQGRLVLALDVRIANLENVKPETEWIGRMAKREAEHGDDFTTGAAPKPKAKRAAASKKR